MIGPNVIQAIIDHTGDNWKGFPFLFALCTAASLVIWFGASRCFFFSVRPPFRGTRTRLTGVTGVDVTTGRRDAVAWAEKNRAYAQTGVLVSEEDSADSVKVKKL